MPVHEGEQALLGSRASRASERRRRWREQGAPDSREMPSAVAYAEAVVKLMRMRLP
jgi:hypothetical protein